MYPTINHIKQALRDGPERIERADPRIPRKRDYFYVRDASECPVAVWMDCKGMPRPALPGRVLALQRRGLDLEKQALDSIRAFYPETKVHLPTLRQRFVVPYMVPRDPTHEGQDQLQSDAFWVAGRPDALLRNTILEIKSVGDEKFDDLADPDRIPQRHWDQLLLYGKMFKGYDLVLILVSRDDHRYRVCSAKPDPDRVDYLLDRLGRVARALKDDVPPERDLLEPCAYWCACWTMKNNEQESLQTSTPPEKQEQGAYQAATTPPNDQGENYRPIETIS